MGEPAVFYFDLASPYAYLSSHRVDQELGATLWRPILVGALHKHFRRVSWGATPQLRAEGISEIETRAARYGLPPVKWPDPYPANSLVAMRAAVWAAKRGAARSFASAAFAMAFQEAVDLTSTKAVLLAGERAGLDPGALEHALNGPELKQELRVANDAAIAAGVFGVPTFDAGGHMWWGDHLLAAAALAMGRA